MLSFSNQHYFNDLQPHSTHIWTFRFSQKLDQLDACAALLSDEEQNRVKRFINVKDQHKACLGLAWRRFILASYLDINPTNLIFSYSKSGKPLLDNIQFSVSHTDDYWAIAVSHHIIGLDLEITQKKLSPIEIAQRFFTPVEALQVQNAVNPQQKFLQIWTAKEAYLKALGKGITDGLDKFEVTVLDDNHRQLNNTSFSIHTLNLWLDVSDALVYEDKIDKIEKIYF